MSDRRDDMPMPPPSFFGAVGNLRNIIGDAFVGFAGYRRSTTRMRHQTLLLLRWMAIFGQAGAIVFVHFGLGFSVPLLWCAIPILASVWLNIFLGLRYSPIKRLSDTEAAFYMGFDIIQLTSLLAFTGGLLNPFCVLLLAPVTVAATTLSLRSALVLASITMVGVTLMGLFQLHLPLPWYEAGFILPWTYEIGVWIAVMLAIGFSGISAWRVAAETNRMSDALSATEMVLAREQRLSAVGGLAAAAAHELGSPLATISLVTRELEREVDTDHPLADDVRLLLSQAERCRDILNRLTLEAQEGTAQHTHVPLQNLMEEIAEPHRMFGVDVRVQIRSRLPDDHPLAKNPAALDVWRRPEIVHGLGNIVENAVDFAKNEVIFEALVSEKQIRVRIIDDGPGFAKDVLDHLGEPFNSTRPRIGSQSEAKPGDALPDADSDNHGMGLGFFIAKTLLERSGGRLQVSNRNTAQDTPPQSGAIVSITWPLSAYEGETGDKE